MFGFLKALASFIVPRPVSSFFLPRTSVNYEKAVGRGFGSSVVMAPTRWIARTFPQSKLTVSDQEGEAQPNHAMLQLVSKPNPFYADAALWSATIFSYVLAGNAYWLIIRDERSLEPVELWYVPHWLMKPIQGEDGASFIVRYDYSPRGTKIPIEPSDVIHFRDGLDPQNVTLGISPLASLWREVFTDDEAANFTAALLRNQGLAGVVIAPAKGVPTKKGEAEEVERYINERLTGDRRGKPLVAKAATQVHQMGFSPDQMNLSALRNVPEERVCSALVIPAAVVGFGTGLEQTKVGATMREMVRLAWTSNLIPMGKVFASELQRCLLPEFEPRSEDFEVSFSTDAVEALQDTANDKVDRTVKLFTAAIITRAQAKQDTGHIVADGDDVYLVPASAIEVEANTPEKSAPSGGGGTKDHPFDLSAVRLNGSPPVM